MTHDVIGRCIGCGQALLNGHICTATLTGPAYEPPVLPRRLLDITVLARDAARYRYLRTCAEGYGQDREDNRFWQIAGWNDRTATFDEAVDRAMQRDARRRGEVGG